MIKNFNEISKILKSLEFIKEAKLTTNQIRDDGRIYWTTEKTCLIYKLENNYFVLEYQKFKDRHQQDYYEIQCFYQACNKNILLTETINDQEKEIEIIFRGSKTNKNNFNSLKNQNGLSEFFEYLTDKKRITETKNLIEELHLKLIKARLISPEESLTIKIEKNIQFFNFSNKNQNSSKNTISLSKKFRTIFRRLNKFQNQLCLDYFDPEDSHQCRSFRDIQFLQKISYHKLVSFQRREAAEKNLKKFNAYQNNQKP